MTTITVGVNLAKQLFSVCEVDIQGAIRGLHDLRRDNFAVWLAQLPAETSVAWKRAVARIIERVTTWNMACSLS